jgi:hypothetical protein
MAQYGSVTKEPCLQYRKGEYMTRSSSILMAVAIFFAFPAHAAQVEFWHSSTLWANHGQCAAIFSFDSSMELIRNLQVSFSAFNKAGKKVASDVLEIRQFGQSNADRYGSASVAGEEYCADDLTIVVTKATAVVEGKQIDLLKTKAINARDFKPYKIRIGK